jgi:hypothetical protein
MPLNLEEIKELLDYPNPPGDEETLGKLVQWTNELIEEEGLESIRNQAKALRFSWEEAKR